MNILQDIEKGEEIQFKAARIIKGNPVTGKFISQDEEWITVELTKYIEGMANAWDIGEHKTFRKAFLTDLIKLQK